MKGIPEWIVSTAEAEGVDVSGYKNINLNDPVFQQLNDQYRKGSLSENDADAFEEIEYLRDVINVAVAKLSERMTSPEKEAATKTLPDTDKIDEVPDLPEEKAEVPPPLPSGKDTPERKKTIIPGKGEPDTTKWKEVRFNKRAGKWQAVVTTRVVRNYDSEVAALDAAKTI